MRLINLKSNYVGLSTTFGGRCSRWNFHEWGGIDSTTISAIAAQHHPGIKAFTLGYQNDAADLDEVTQAEATARLHAIQHIVERVNPRSVLDNLTNRVKHYEEPAYGLGANYTISKLAKNNNVTVVLNGLGGDELFAGYAYYRHASRTRFGWLRPLTSLVNLLGNRKISVGSRFLLRKLRIIYTPHYSVKQMTMSYAICLNHLCIPL